MEGLQERKENILEGIQERKEDAKAQLQEIREKQKYYLEKKKYSMSDNMAIANLLRRNPSAVSGRHELAFKEYRDKLIESIKREVGELTKTEEDAESTENK